MGCTIARAFTLRGLSSNCTETYAKAVSVAGYSFELLSFLALGLGRARSRHSYLVDVA